LARSKVIPQRRFRIGRIASQPPGAVGLHLFGTTLVAIPPHPARQSAPTSPRKRGEVIIIPNRGS
jgi:hypothetical protein